MAVVPERPGVSRSAILLAVIGIHALLLGLLLQPSGIRRVGAVVDRPIEVTVIPSADVPKLRFSNIHPQELRTDIASGLSQPLLNSSSDPGPGSAPDGHGPSVNWRAEARRALRAFEIRRDQGPSSAESVSVPLDERRPREHHAGDQYKTANGDWIVWIDADCYQVASGRSIATVNPANPPQTICPDRSATASQE